MSSLRLIEVDGADALARYRELKADHASSGVCPFLIGEVDDATEILQNYRKHMIDSEQSPEQIVQESEQITFEELLQRWSGNMDLGDIDSVYEAEAETIDEDDLEMVRGFRAFADSPNLQVLKSFNDVPHRRVTIGLIECPETWQLPAYLNYGGWNECPMPEEHCAIWRHWQKTYGAEICTGLGSTLEALLKQPLNTFEQARQVAYQQMLYCSDIVWQGTDTVTALAAGLENAANWFFWWD